jgi:hypothetical protein
MVLVAVVSIVAADADAGSAPAKCSFTGKVTLLRDGRPVPADGGIVVYVKTVPDSSWKAPHHDPYQVVQRRLGVDDFEFSEGVKVILENETIEFTNPTEENHDVFSQSEGTFHIKENPYRSTGVHAFTEAGTFHVQCDIHPSMRMDVLVVHNPFFTAVAPDGSFALPPLPRREYRLVAWERNGGEAIVDVRCPGKTSAEITLKENPTPPHRHKDNTPFKHNDRWR